MPNAKKTMVNVVGWAAGFAFLAAFLAMPVFAQAPGAREDCDPGEQPISAASPLATREAPSAVVLYDNGPLVNCPGCGAGGADESQLQTALSMNTLGFGHQYSLGYRLADDFLISDSKGWYIDMITFFAYQTGSETTSTITGAYLQIWDGPPDNLLSSVVWGNMTTNRLQSTGWSNIYRVTDTTTGSTNRPVMANVVKVNRWLPAGIYWLDWSTDGSLASGPWAPPITINGQTTTGNALQYTTAWANALDSGTSTQQGLPFVLNGSVGPHGLVAPLIPLLLTEP